MTMTEAIQKAVDAGYPDEGDLICYPENTICNGIFLDPLFWQALGKNLGWSSDERCGHSPAKHLLNGSCNEWENKWHRFITHLSEAHDIPSFFAEIK